MNECGCPERRPGVLSFNEKVVHGNALDMRSLAREAGLTERYVSKVFGCALLAPDIIESILEGRQPHDLNFEKLCKARSFELGRAARPVWIP